MNSRRGSLCSALCVAVLSVGPLAACDSGDEGISAEDLRAALLVSDDLGDEFEVSADDQTDDDEDSPEWGCLLDFEDDLEEAGGEAEPGDDDLSVVFEASSEVGMPGVIENIVVSETEDDAEQAMSKVAELMGTCHSVDSTDDDTRWQFTVDSDQVAWAEGVEQQVNMVATGTASFSSIELPMAMSFSLMRVGTVTTMVLFMDMASDVEQARRDVIDVAMGRVHAAIDGEEQPDPANVLEDYPVGQEFADLLGQTTDA